MLSKRLKISIALIATSLVAVTTLFALTGNGVSLYTVADTNKSITLTNSDLSKFTSSETGDYRLHPVTFGSRHDRSFRIPLADGHYINGLLLHGDCGGQTITDLGHYTTVRHSGSGNKAYFNYNIVLGCKGIVSAAMKVTLAFADGYTGCQAIFNISTTSSVISDDLIEDDHAESGDLAEISRTNPSGNSYNYLYGQTHNFSSDTHVQETGVRTASKTGGNAVVFRINGYMTNDVPENSLSVTVNSLTVTYSC